MAYSGERSGARTARYQALGKRLVEVFAAAGETQDETAARLDIKQSYVSRLVNGKDRPSIQLLGKINRLYQLDDLDGLMKLGLYIEDPDAPDPVDEREEIARRAAEEASRQTLSRLLEAGWGPLQPSANEYDLAFNHAWRAAKARLEAEGITTTNRGALEGGPAGLTAADAAAEVAAIEQLLRKHSQGTG